VLRTLSVLKKHQKSAQKTEKKSGSEICIVCLYILYAALKEQTLIKYVAVVIDPSIILK
jgi:hypothetical protein